MSTEKIKSLGAFTRKYEHNYKRDGVPNSDINRRHLNEEIIKLPEGMTYVDAFKDKMAKLGHTPRSNAVLGVELVMTYNPREVDEEFDIEKWKEANVEWLKTQFPEDCILSVVMHRDEGPDNGKSAHLHAIVLPVYEEKLNCKHYLSGRKKLIDLQDSYGKAMEPLGLERGLRGSSAKHEDIRKFYDSLNKSLKQKPPEILDGEEIPDYIKRVNEFFEDLNLKHLQETKKLKREIDELKTKLKMAKFEAQSDVKKDVEELKKERDALKIKLAEIEEREKLVAQKEKTLEGTEERLTNFNALMKGLKEHPDTLLTSGLAEDISTIIDWQKEQDRLAEEREEEELEDDIY
jgi:hypothetical protein